MLNSRGIADYTIRLADALEQVLDSGEFPVVLGGDCRIVLGNLLALRRRGRYGLLFIDGLTPIFTSPKPTSTVRRLSQTSRLQRAWGRGPLRLSRICTRWWPITM